MFSKKCFHSILLLISLLFSQLVYASEEINLIKNSNLQMDSSPTKPPPRFKKVIYVIFENAAVASVMKNPIFKDLADKNVFLSNVYATGRPSQPNYLAMVAGDFFGVNSNSNIDLNYTHIGDLLEAKGMDWRAVAEDYPGNCFTGASSGKYTRKHAPFISFNNVRTNPARCAKITNDSTFLKDWKDGKLPAFTFYSPHMDNDGHDSSIDFAADWFKGAFLDEIQKTPSMLADTLLIVTYDEGAHFGANQVYTVLLGAGAKAGLKVTDQLSHYSLLKMIEDEWGLGNLGRNDKTAAPIQNIFN